jgi:hypothetical protein
MTYDLQIHHRRSIRLKGYDYSLPGAYFVTSVTWQCEEIFGTVFNGEMQLSSLGKIVQTEWFRSAEIRKEIRLFEDEFVVMPNHVHGIVWIVNDDFVGADGVRPVIDGVRDAGVRDAGVCDAGVCDAGVCDAGACHAPLHHPQIHNGRSIRRAQYGRTPCGPTGNEI